MAAQCFSYTKYLNPAAATLATPFPKAARTCRMVVAASSPKDVALQSKGRDRYIPGKVKAERVYWEFPGFRVLLSSGLPVSSRGPSLPINIPVVETLLDSVKWDEKGLAVAIAQNVDTGAVLMQGFANRDALATTISSRKATFYSRSRSSLWTKGETSSNFINVHDVFLDCDRDSIIYLGKPDGPTCHTGSETCYYTSVLDLDQKEDNKLASTTLYALETTISDRKAELALQDGGKPSWTKKLLVDHKLLCSKLREEADELCRTLEENEDEGRTASEMGDVLYHAMVLLALKGVKMEDVLEDLRKRFSQSGIEEKRGRSSQSRS